MGSDSYGSGKLVNALIKLATDDQQIAADITKRILLGESLEDIWFDKWKDIDYLEVFLDKFNVDVNIKDGDDDTALIWVSICGNSDIVKWLLEHGADVDIQNKDGNTTLHYASSHTNYDIVKLLLEHGADPNIKNKDGNTALDRAKTREMKELLKQHGAKTREELKKTSTVQDDQKIVAGITKRILLGESLEDIWFDWCDNIDYMRVLLEKFHVDPNIRSKYDYTQLMWASSNNRLDVVQCLLEHEADPNTQTKYGETALQYAHTKEMKELLKQYGAKPREELRKTSAIQDDQKIVADITKRILLGESLEEIWFKSYKNLDYIRILLDKFNIDVNIQNKGGKTALYWASYHNNLDIVRLLLEHGADVNIQNKDGNTALHLASYANNLDFVRLLLEHGADVNIKDKYGQTALFWASVNNNLDFVKLLLEHGADPNIKDVNGDTILDTCQNLEIRELLKQCGGTSIHF